MNSVILIGRLTKDPEMAYTPNTNTAVCRFTIAVDRPRRQGEEQGADYIRITVWGKQAETCDRFLNKGRQVAVNGRIQTGSYKDKNGNTVYTTDVVANNVEFLGGKSEPAEAPAEKPMEAPAERPMDTTLGNYDDLPPAFSYTNDGMPF